MKKLEIGSPARLDVTWYDKVPEPPKEEIKEGEVIGWREAQVIVRVPGYAVLRFWKKSGLEVGNAGHPIRGWRVDLSALPNGLPARGLEGLDINIAE